jgi:hypothetical protein
LVTATTQVSPVTTSEAARRHVWDCGGCSGGHHSPGGPLLVFGIIHDALLFYTGTTRTVRPGTTRLRA